MWHIINTTNKDILDMFKKEVSDKVFYMLLDISRKLELKKVSLDPVGHEIWKYSTIYHKSTKKELFNYIW